MNLMQGVETPAPVSNAVVDWSMLGAWATVITGVLTIISVTVAIVAVVHQSRALRRTLASQTYHSLIEHFNQFQVLIVNDPQLRRDLFSKHPRLLSRLRRHRVHWALGVLFNWYEDVALQSDSWLIIPDHLRTHWLLSLAHELDGNKTISDYWAKYGHRYHPLLGAWVTEARQLLAAERDRSNQSSG